MLRRCPRLYQVIFVGLAYSLALSKPQPIRDNSPFRDVIRLVRYNCLVFRNIHPWGKWRILALVYVRVEPVGC